MPEASSERAANLAFWGAAAALAGLKLALVSDLSVQIIYAPHDDAIYLERAFHLLHGEGFGPYDSRILVKLPGLSLWLAGLRLLGAPYLITLNLLYTAAGCYFASALLRCGFGRLLAIATLTVFLFNPITLGYEWIRIIREPLSTTLLVLLAAAMLHILVLSRERRLPLAHVLIASLVFGMALLVREDDRLLWGLLALFVLALAWANWHWQALGGANAWLCMALVAALPSAVAIASNLAVREFVEQRYGVPLLHDFSEGEFPRLAAAMRSIDSAKDNRLVMVTQEKLQKLHAEIPRLRPVIERLPRPSPASYSCVKDGVCSEWGNGWMMFWIKDAAYDAGLTPSLPAAQRYFREMREEIESACGAGRLKCRDRGGGLIPPMELRWTRGVWEQWRRLAVMTLVTEPYVVEQPPTLFRITPELGRVYQAVTMSDYFDAQAQASPLDRPASRPYRNPLAQWRKPLAQAYLPVAEYAQLAAFAVVLFWSFSRRVVLGPFAILAVALTLYGLLRISALAYVAAFMGALDHRFMFSNFSLLTLLSIPVIGAAVQMLRRARSAASGPARYETL